MKKKPIFTSVITGFLFVILSFSFSLAVSSPIPDCKLRYNERSLSLNNPIEQSNASRLLFQVQLEMQQANMSESNKHVKRNLTLKYAQNIGIAYLGGIGGILFGVISFPVFRSLTQVIFSGSKGGYSAGWIAFGYAVILDAYITIPLGSTVALKYQKNESANPYLTYLGGILSTGLVLSTDLFIRAKGQKRTDIRYLLFATSLAIQPLGCAIAFSLSDSYQSKKDCINKDEIGNSIGFLKPGINISPDKQMSVRITLVEYNF